MKHLPCNFDMQIIPTVQPAWNLQPWAIQIASDEFYLQNILLNK